MLVIKMMMVVIGLFFILNGIVLNCSFVYIFNGDKLCNDFYYKIFILVLNLVVNFLVYVIFKRDIKKEFKSLIYKYN